MVASEPSAAPVTVTRATARLAVRTHHGADSISGLRVSGRCAAGTVRLTVGHRPPYEPLRRTGIPQIDRTTPPRRAVLTAPCKAGRYAIRVPQISVRYGTGALAVQAPGGPQVPVDTNGQAIE